MKQFALVLAGGSGKRLWPFSRQNSPKQFIQLPNGTSLLEATLQRLTSLHSLTPLILTTQQHAERAASIARKYRASTLAEPCSKNTAPAIALGCHELSKNHGDAVVAIMPTDHTIHHTTAFIDSLRYALNYVQRHDVVLLYGAPQTSISTRFGFITLDKQLPSDGNFPLYNVATFHEKPSHDQASQYYKDRQIVWNMGIFVGRISTILNLYRFHAPDIIDGLERYDTITPRAFDHAILEHACERLVVLAHDFGWNDIGNLNEFIPSLRLQEKKLELYGSHNNVTVTDKPVIFAGASDLTVIELPDMILVSQRAHLESSESIAQQISHLGRKDLL